jgi:hypothetical protein
MAPPVLVGLGQPPALPAVVRIGAVRMARKATWRTTMPAIIR